MAISRIEIDRATTDRGQLIELMAILLDQRATDPIAELANSDSGEVLDHEEGLVEVLHEIQTLQLGS
jgi:hypothetical protein